MMIDSLISAAPRADERPATMCQPVGEIAASILAEIPGGDLASADEIAELIAAIADGAVTRPHSTGARATVRGKVVYANRGRIQFDSFCRFYSPYMPGLFLKLPADPGAPARARRAIGEKLAALGHRGPGADAIKFDIPLGRENGDLLIVKLPAPEKDGAFQSYLQSFGHATEGHTRHLARRIAREISGRWEHRHTLRQWLDELEAQAAAYVAKQDGLEIVGAFISRVDWETDMTPKSVHVTIDLSSIGDNLKPKKRQAVVTDGKDALGHLKSVAAKHRAAMRTKKTGGGPVICSILAKAIRNSPPRFHADLLKELSGVLDGGYTNPKNPRLRKISNISMQSGLISAPITLGKGARYEKGRVVIKKVTLGKKDKEEKGKSPQHAFPQTVLSAIIGQPINEVIEHPFLTDAPIVSASNNSVGTYVRPERRSEPVGDVVEWLKRSLDPGS